MVSSSDAFVDVVARARGLHMRATDHHAFRLQPNEDSPAWFCDMDQGTPTDEDDPASFVRWVCPELKISRSARAWTPLLAVHRAGPHSDLGRFVAWLSRRATGSPVPGPGSRYTYTDPHEILDAYLRHRIENWPPAWHGDGVMRPAELWSIRVTAEGLIIESGSWWSSAPALEHQIALALDIAGRLTALRGDGPRS